MSKVKICGLRRKEDIAYVNAYHPDYAGFILSKPFRRYVSTEALFEMKNDLDPDIAAVGVFVDESAEYIMHYLKHGLIDIVQLHGSEPDDLILTLKKEYPEVPVIRSFEVKSAETLDAANRCPADIVLLDSGKGSGRTFAWELLAHMKRPYILAGGLNPENVEEAVRTLRPYGVDTSSGVETDGIKDETKIRDFIEKVRSIQEE